MRARFEFTTARVVVLYLAGILMGFGIGVMVARGTIWPMVLTPVTMGLLSANLVAGAYRKSAPTPDVATR